jgi:hypothetical protein
MQRHGVRTAAGCGGVSVGGRVARPAAQLHRAAPPYPGTAHGACEYTLPTRNGFGFGFGFACEVCAPPALTLPSATRWALPLPLPCRGEPCAARGACGDVAAKERRRCIRQTKAAMATHAPLISAPHPPQALEATHPYSASPQRIRPTAIPISPCVRD